MNTRIGLLATMAAILAAPAAWAAETAPAPAELGAVRASGEGCVWALGKGAIEYNLNGTGTLIIFDSSVNRISLIGDGDHVADGKVMTFTGFKGTVHVEGPSVASRFSGGKVEIRGSGSLSLILTGEGQYWLADGPARDWNKDGSLVSVGPPAPPAADNPATAATAAPTPAPTFAAAPAVEVRPIEIRTVYVTEPTTVLRTSWVYYYDYPTVRYSVSTWPWYYSTVIRPTYVRPYCPSPPPRLRYICTPPRTVHNRPPSHFASPPPGRCPPAVPMVGGTLSFGAAPRGGGFSPGAIRTPPGGGSHLGGRGSR